MRLLTPCGTLTAEGTCMKEFTWNGGGTWQGRAWTPDLPTDAALLFYLFAAFLEAPRCAIVCHRPPRSSVS